VIWVSVVSWIGGEGEKIERIPLLTDCEGCLRSGPAWTGGGAPKGRCSSSPCFESKPWKTAGMDGDASVRITLMDIHFDLGCGGGFIPP